MVEPCGTGSTCWSDSLVAGLWREEQVVSWEGNLADLEVEEEEPERSHRES